MGTPKRSKWKVKLEIGNDASSPGNSGSDTSLTSTPHELGPFPKADSAHGKGAGVKDVVVAPSSGSCGRGKDDFPSFESRFVASLKLSLDVARE